MAAWKKGDRHLAASLPLGASPLFQQAGRAPGNAGESLADRKLVPGESTAVSGTFVLAIRRHDRPGTLRDRNTLPPRAPAGGAAIAIVSEIAAAGKWNH